MVVYMSNIQPPYGISRYKYYKVNKDNKRYYITNDYKNKIYYTEQEIRKLYTTDNWDEIFPKNKNIDEEKKQNQMNSKKQREK